MGIFIKFNWGGNMISNQILQSTIDGLKNITRKDLSVVEKEGKVIATTEENMIGRQIDAIENFVGSQADSQLILGYQYFKVYDNGICNTGEGRG